MTGSRARRRLRPLPALALVFAAAAAIASGCGADHEVVGGRCAAGYTQCGSRCVNLLDDNQNCGACDVVCDPGSCVEGKCRNGVDGSLADGSPGDGQTGTPDGASGDGSENGDGPPNGDGAALGDGAMGDGTAGDGPLADGAATDASADAPIDDGAIDDGAAGDVTPISCDAGLTFCGTCVDLQSDPNNCGKCRLVCASQICNAGVCAGATPGNVVFIGHDYESTPNGTAQARVLTNAVFLAQPANVHVLSYEKYADVTASTRVHGILASASAPAGRTLTVTATTNDGDVAGLNFLTYQVLLVLDQTNATVDLGVLGTSWAPTLATFAQAGGVVVVLDGGSGAHQMPAFVTGTGLLSVTADAQLAVGTAVQVAAPGDALGVGVLSPYAAGLHSVSITTEPAATNLVYVVVAPNDAGSPPVVVHKVL